MKKGYEAVASVAQSAYGAYETAKQQVIARQGMDLEDPFGARQLAIGAQMLRNAQQKAADRTAGQLGSTLGAGTGGFAVEAVASVLEMPSDTAAGLANLALPGGAAMWQGREPSEAELAYAPARRQQVAGLKAALNPNLPIPERAAHGFAAVAATPIAIVEGLTWGAGGKASDAVGEHVYKAWTAPTATDAGLQTLEAGQQLLGAFVSFGSLAAPLSSRPAPTVAEPAPVRLQFAEAMESRWLYNRKVGELKALSDEGLLAKTKPAARTLDTGQLKSDLIKRIYDQYHKVNPEFADKAIRRVQSMQYDHTWELQLGGGDVRPNLRLLDRFNELARGDTADRATIAECAVRNPCAYPDGVRWILASGRKSRELSRLGNRLCCVTKPDACRMG